MLIDVLTSHEGSNIKHVNRNSNKSEGSDVTHEMESPNRLMRIEYLLMMNPNISRLIGCLAQEVKSKQVKEDRMFDNDKVLAG